MTILWSNNASGALASSISPSSTTIVLAAGQGVEFPTPGGGNYFYATLTDTSNNLEVVKVTARVVDTLTVVRGQDSTAARSYPAGALLELRVTAAALSDMQASSAQLSDNNTFSGTNTFSGNTVLAGTVTLGTTWTIVEQSGKLVFRQGGVPKFSMDSAGVFTAVGDVTSEGTI